MHRLLFLELQSKPALRTFATDTSLLRTLVRTTDTCFLRNQQIRIERQSCSVTRSLHYQLRAVIDLSFLKVKNLQLTGVSMFLPSATVPRIG